MALASPTAIIGDLSGSSVDYDDVVSSEVHGIPLFIYDISNSLNFLDRIALPSLAL